MKTSNKIRWFALLLGVFMALGATEIWADAVALLIILGAMTDTEFLHE